MRRCTRAPSPPIARGRNSAPPDPRPGEPEREAQGGPKRRSPATASVLGSIHANHAAMALSSNLVLQLHRDLFQFTSSGGGSWKDIDNEITARHADGRTSVRFKAVAAHLTPASMDGLHRGLGDALDAGIVNPLFIVPTYMLDFLCVHPFRDGNGRMARLLSLLLLYKSGYHVGRYISSRRQSKRRKRATTTRCSVRRRAGTTVPRPCCPGGSTSRGHAADDVSHLRGAGGRDVGAARREARHDHRRREAPAAAVQVQAISSASSRRSVVRRLGVRSGSCGTRRRSSASSPGATRPGKSATRARRARRRLQTGTDDRVTRRWIAALTVLSGRRRLGGAGAAVDFVSAAAGLAALATLLRAGSRPAPDAPAWRCQ